MDKQKASDRLRIAGAFRSDSMVREIWRAAQRRLARVPGCRSASFNPESALDELRRWRPDAILAHIHRRDLLAPLQELGVPIANTSGILDDLPVPTVSPDNLASGRLAGEHLLAKGYRTFAFVGLMDHGYARDRLAGFVEAVEVEADALPVFGEGSPSYQNIVRMEDTSNLQPLMDWLDELPAGTGILAADDVRAGSIIGTLEAMGVDPAERFGIVSGHDRELPVHPAISAVTIPEQRWGEEAAMLAVHLARGEADDGDVTFAPLGVIERESTLGVATADADLRAAVTYIHNHADAEIYVEDVVAATTLGRRAMERRFREMLGRTILQEIHRVHVEHAKMLLAETDFTVEEVAAECGLTDVNHLLRLFRKQEGTSPGVYRKQFRLQHRPRQGR